MIRAGVTAIAVALVSCAPAWAGSLYGGPPPRPGPDVLYAPPVAAPQLENDGVWRAPPILVSGATAYRDGEFLYQDFLYDDHGANGAARDPGDERLGSDVFAAPNGTYTYPKDPAYAGNAADLVELRVRPLRNATAFRLTLNTMVDPSLVAATIALGDSPAPRPLPHGANASAPAELFATVRGSGGGDLVDAASGRTLGERPAVAVDARRRQIDVRVPRSAWDPGAGAQRIAAGVGLWDRADDRYLVPALASSATAPGGAGALVRPAAFFNVAFRSAEPLPEISEPAEPAWWRDRLQGSELRDGDLSRLHAIVDFGKLARRVDDDAGVPRTGPLNRILVSRFEEGPGGADYTPTCDAELPDRCSGELQGRLQPYALYVPRRPRPAGGYPLTLLLHSLSASYNQFSGSRNQSQFGERGDGSLVVTPAGRGPDGWYTDRAEADVFEVWADVARHYALDPGRATVAGYSMGGYGTFRLATRYPDLFARGQPTVGPPEGPAHDTAPQLASLRNLPLLMWVAAADELVPVVDTQRQADAIDALGYRYEHDVFAGEHLTLAVNDEYGPAARFLAGDRVRRDPPHVTFVVNRALDSPDADVVADHAYWLSDVRPRDGTRGTIDVRSGGFGEGDPPARPTQRGAGVLTGGALPALPFTRQWRQWGQAPAEPRADTLFVRAENVAAVTVHVTRARVSCKARLDVRSDGPLAIRLAGCPDGVRRFG